MYPNKLFSYQYELGRFGNWAVQRCLEAAFTPEERKKIASCMRYPGINVIKFHLS